MMSKNLTFIIGFFLTFSSILVAGEIKVTTIYDNYISQKGCTANWGFSCLVEGAGKTILFDTGWDPRIFVQNCKTLGINLRDIDAVVLSHDHNDHTGGLDTLLSLNKGIDLYMGESFSKSFTSKVVARGVKPIMVSSPVEICPHVYSTGEIKSGLIPEQTLVIESEDGLILITGCSHPGIERIVINAIELYGNEVALVYGGFHMPDQSRKKIQKVIGGLMELGVNRVGPTHCTGEEAIALFREDYAEYFESTGTGKVIQAVLQEN